MNLKLDVSGGVEIIPISLFNDINDEQVRDFVYTRCNIPGPDTDFTDFETQLEGCSCQGVCLHVKCHCMRFGSSYIPEQRLMDTILDSNHAQHSVSKATHEQCQLLINAEEKSCQTQQPIIECNDLCLCIQRNDTCSNRVVQLGIQIQLEVFQTEVKGWGLRSPCPIPRGTFVCEYAGEVLTYKEAKRRTELLASCDSNYLIVLKEHLGDGTILRTHVDPVNIGNVGRFINHSCEPNLNMYPVRVNNAVVKLALFANQDIKANKELCFNYTGDNASLQEAHVIERHSRTSTQRSCDCGTASCSGYLPFDDSLFDADNL